MRCGQDLALALFGTLLHSIQSRNVKVSNMGKYCIYLNARQL